jgi:ketosteroid isomerase-like protein
MTSDESKHVVRQYQTALASGDLDKAKSLVSPDATYWTACCPPRWGRPVTRDEFFGGTSRFADSSATPWEFTYGPMIAEGNKVALQGESRVRLTNGKLYNNFYHVYFELEDGKIVTVREYHDTLHLVECFNGSDAFLGQPVRYSPFTGQPSA